MYTPHVLVATVAVMAGMTAAVSTNFTLDSYYPGCVASVVSECDLGCSAIAVFSDTKNCDEIGKVVTQPACNGTVSVDLTEGKPTTITYKQGQCKAACTLYGGSCHVA